MQPVPLQQYRPRQHALLLPRDCYSGYSLGYHATIVRLHTSSLRRFPTCPRMWEYTIYVPYRNHLTREKARDLVVYDKFDSGVLPVQDDDRLPQYHIHTKLAPDNQSIDGALRGTSNGDWMLFTFEKTSQPHLSMQLNAPTSHSRVRVSRVQVSVAESEILDLSYVRDRLRKFLIAGIS